MAIKKTAATQSVSEPKAAAPVKSEAKGSGTAVAPKAAAKTIAAPSYDAIATRAFCIYANRGYAPGDPIADWLEAESQLKAGL
jgi:hypothetical protein